MKKLISLLVVLLMVVSLVACSTPSQAPSDTPADQPSAPADKPADDDPADEPADPPAAGGYETPVQVSMNVMDAEKNGNHVRNEIVKEMFNLTFEYIPTSWGDWNTKISTWIGAGDAPDLIWWDLKGAQANQYKTWARQGAFAEYKPEYFTDARPNLKNTYENGASIEALSVDGKLYAWPSLRDNLPEQDDCYTSNWSYRRDWAKAVGLYNENDVYTWDEWMALCYAIKDQDPGKNGDANAVLVMDTWAFPHAPVLFIGAPEAEGNETCSYIERDGTYVWPPATEEYKKGVKITYDLYQDGIIYNDNLNFTGNEKDNIMKSGLGFAAYSIIGNLNGWTDDMLRDGILENREDLGMAVVISWDGTWYMTQTEDYWTVTAMDYRLEDDAEKVNRILDFWEYLHTIPGKQMRTWGKEGVDFNVTGEGLNDVELLWDYDEELQNYVDPYASNHAFNEANGAVNGPRTAAPGTLQYQNDEQNRMWALYGSGDYKTHSKKFDYKVSFGSAPNKDKDGSFGSECKEKLVALLPQAGLDIEAEWDKVVAEFMPRVQLVLDEINNGELK